MRMVRRGRGSLHGQAQWRDSFGVDDDGRAGSFGLGRSNKEIAHELGIAEGTVKNHMSNVIGKLGALDRTQAALRARELGLI